MPSRKSCRRGVNADPHSRLRNRKAQPPVQNTCHRALCCRKTGPVRNLGLRDSDLE